LAQPTVLSADITAKPLVLSGFTVINKVYDGTTAANLNGTPVLEGVVNGDVLNLMPPVANFIDGTAGAIKAVTLSGYGFSGVAAGNYILIPPTNLMATITPKPNQASPQKLPYQAVVRNSSGKALTNQAVRVRFSIHDSIATGNILYQEIHTATANAQGLLNLNIGQGAAVNGNFASINWGSNNKFIQTEIDITGGSNYTDFGTTQFMSVPYALQAANGLPTGTAKGEMLFWNGSQWVAVAPGVDGQNLTYCNGVPTWGPCH
jgi:hypothetical protein